MSSGAFAGLCINVIKEAKNTALPDRLKSRYLLYTSNIVIFIVSTIDILITMSQYIEGDKYIIYTSIMSCTILLSFIVSFCWFKYRRKYKIILVLKRVSYIMFISIAFFYLTMTFLSIKNDIDFFGHPQYYTLMFGKRQIIRIVAFALFAITFLALIIESSCNVHNIHQSYQENLQMIQESKYKRAEQKRNKYKK